MLHLAPHILQVQQAALHTAALLKLWVQVMDVSPLNGCVLSTVATDEANRLRDWAEDDQRALQVGAQLNLRRLGRLE